MSGSASGVHFTQMKEAMRETWMAGDFEMIAKITAKCGQDFVQRLPMQAGARVLDVACGTGNTAIPLAKRGAEVTGLDIATNLLERARANAKREGVAARFEEGDAEELPYDDASFDVVVSMFGAMFAPRPELVAAELARVLRPGGLLAMMNWTPQGFTGEMFKVSTRHVPPPPGVAPPLLWGDENVVRGRLEGKFREIETAVVPMYFEMPVSPAEAVEYFRKFFGPTKVAFDRLDEDKQNAFMTDLVAMWEAANDTYAQNQTCIKNEYLEVLARRAER